MLSGIVPRKAGAKLIQFHQTTKFFVDFLHYAAHFPAFTSAFVGALLFFSVSCAVWRRQSLSAWASSPVFMPVFICFSRASSDAFPRFNLFFPEIDACNLGKKYLQSREKMISPSGKPYSIGHEMGSFGPRFLRI